MAHSSNSRLAVLAAHLVPTKPSAGTSDPYALSQQACAAHETVRFARPAAPAVRFGRPASGPPSNSDLEVVGRAMAVLAAGGAGAGALHTSPRFSPTDHFTSGVSTAGDSAAQGEGHMSVDLPRFARAVAGSQPRTSPFAAPLPPLASTGGPAQAEAAAAAEASSLTAMPEAAASQAEISTLNGPKMSVFETGYGWEAEVALPGVHPGGEGPAARPLLLSSFLTHI